MENFRKNAVIFFSEVELECFLLDYWQSESTLHLTTSRRVAETEEVGRVAQENTKKRNEIIINKSVETTTKKAVAEVI